MTRRRREWGEIWRALTRGASIMATIVMTMLLAYGISHAVPSKQAVLAMGRAGKALERGEYVLAEQSYDAALRLAPRSAGARIGLACAFYLTGRRSAAAIELTKALEAGAFAERLGNCGHGLDLGNVFFVAKLGLSDAFAAPRVRGAGRFERILTAEPTQTTAEEPGRMLLGACLAQRGGLAGAAWDYGANALQRHGLSESDRARFSACFGPAARRRASCAAGRNILKCLMTPAARAAYFRDVRLVDAPTWREGDG
jgi:hypothetical protein